MMISFKWRLKNGTRCWSRLRIKTLSQQGWRAAEVFLKTVTYYLHGKTSSWWISGCWIKNNKQSTQSLVEWSLGWSASKWQTRTMSWTCIMIHFDNSTSMIPWLSLSNSPNSSVLSAVRGPGLPLFVSGPLLKPCLRCQESTRTSQTSLKLAKDLTNLFLEFSSLFAETK